MELPFVKTLKGLRLVACGGVGRLGKEAPTLERRLADRRDDQRREGSQQRSDLNVARVLADVRIEERTEVVRSVCIPVGEDLNDANN